MDLFIRFIALCIFTAGYAGGQGLGPCVPDPSPQCPCTAAQVGLKRPHPDDCVQYYLCEEQAPGIFYQSPRPCSIGSWGFDEILLECVPFPVCFNGASPPTGTPGTPPPPTDPTTTTPAPPVCPVTGDVNIPDISDCNSYIRCVNGSQTPLQCPEGWTFDYISLECLPYSGTCFPGSSPPTGSPATFPPIDNGTTDMTSSSPSSTTSVISSTTQVASTGTPVTVNPPTTPDIVTTTTTTTTTTTPSTTTEGSVNICRPNVSELLPHPSDCSKFYACVNGVPYVRECQAGYYFDFIELNCVLRINANCVSGCQSSLYGVTFSKFNVLFLIMVFICK